MEAPLPLSCGCVVAAGSPCLGTTPDSVSSFLLCPGCHPGLLEGSYYRRLPCWGEAPIIAPVHILSVVPMLPGSTPNSPLGMSGPPQVLGTLLSQLTPITCV